MAELNFNATGIDTTSTFDPVPAGEYPVIITESEVRDTKSGTGRYLNMTLEIQGGQFQGRKLFDRLNLWNQNAQAVEIAQRQLAQACHAVGLLQVADSSELHFKPLTAIVRVRNEPGQNPQNEIRGYKPAGGVAAQAPAAAAPRPQAAAPAQAPWSKKVAA